MTRIDPATGMHSRLLDYLARLDEAIDVGLADGVDAVLIAGDKNVRYEAVLQVMDQLRSQGITRVGLQVKPAQR